MKFVIKHCAAAALAAVMGLALSGCGGGGTDTSTGSSATTPQPSLTESTLSITPTDGVTADGATNAAITLTLRDANGNVISNSSAAVALKADFGTLSYSSSGGKFTGTLHSTKAGPDTVRFSIDGKTSPNTKVVTFVAGPPDASKSSIVLSAAGADAGATPTAYADGVTPLIATVTLRDKFGNAITHGGDQVDISTSRGAVGSVTDNGDGTYTADITSITTGTESATFAVGAVKTKTQSLDSARANAGSGLKPLSATPATAAFSAPPASAASNYMAPWTLLNCKTYNSCVYSDVYEADTTKPNQPAIQVVSGALMSMGWQSQPAFGVLYRANYDPATDTVTQLGPAALFYAKDNAIYRLDLMHAGATPQRLSTLAPTAVCSIYLISPYDVRYGWSGAGDPALVAVSGFDTAGATPDDCMTAVPTTWYLPAAGDSTSVPLEQSFAYWSPQALVDPATGVAQGFVEVDGSGNLDLYSTDLSTHQVLQADFAPAGAIVQILNSGGIHDTLVMDVAAVSAGTRHDDLYRVTQDSVTPVTSLSVSSSNPFFSDCGVPTDATNYLLESQTDSADDVYFPYPTAAGMSVEALSAGSTSPASVYDEPAGYCVYSTNFASSGRLVLVEDGAPGNGSRVISIDVAGASSQAPTLLRSEPDGGFVQVHYYSKLGDDLWMDDAAPCSSGCTGEQIVVYKPDGTLQKNFTGSAIGGDAQQGTSASNGTTLRKYVAIVPDGGTCTSTGWVLYDPATMTPVAAPDFGAGNCVNNAFIYGPNDSFLMGGVADSAGTGSSAFALFGVGGPLVDFGHYDPLPGYSTVVVTPMY